MLAFIMYETLFIYLSMCSFYYLQVSFYISTRASALKKKIRLIES